MLIIFTIFKYDYYKNEIVNQELPQSNINGISNKNMVHLV